MKTIAIIGTFDTKGREFKYIKDLVEAAGLGTLCIHTGIFAFDVVLFDKRMLC